MTIRIGTRGSQLALTQTKWFEAQMRAAGRETELIIIKTQGDKLTHKPLTQIGGQGVFVKELEDALIAGEIDLAVHSLKDLSTTIPDELTIAVVPEREDPRDAFCSRLGETLDTIQGRATVATSSMRRRAQILAARPDLQVVDVRGNIDTRLRKLTEGEFDALVMAAAGLNRMGWQEQISQLLPFDICMPAPGQGALAIETRADDEELLAFLKPFNHYQTRASVEAERAFLAALGGGCLIPVGAIGSVHDDMLTLRGMVSSSEGKRILREKVCLPANDPTHAGRELADRMLSLGANEILGEWRVEGQEGGG